MKQFLTIVCLFAISLQALPVKQVGALLCKNQLTEELPNTDDAKETKGKVDFKKDYLFVTAFANINFIQSVSSQYIHYSTALPAFYAGDIQTPPPDAA